MVAERKWTLCDDNIIIVSSDPIPSPTLIRDRRRPLWQTFRRNVSKAVRRDFNRREKLLLMTSVCRVWYNSIVPLLSSARARRRGGDTPSTFHPIASSSRLLLLYLRTYICIKVRLPIHLSFRNKTSLNVPNLTSVCLSTFPSFSKRPGRLRAHYFDTCWDNVPIRAVVFQSVYERGRRRTKLVPDGIFPSGTTTPTQLTDDPPPLPLPETTGRAVWWLRRSFGFRAWFFCPAPIHDESGLKWLPTKTI